MKNNRQRANGVKGIIWGVLWACASVAGAQDVWVEVVERSTPGGIFAQTSTTRLTSETHTTRTAPTESTGYALAHWTVNGVRGGADYGRALNPVTFVVTQAMDAVAVYFPTNQDSSGLGVPDWWHYRYYGTLTNAVDSDTDADGIELAREYILDLNPQVPNVLESGGVSLRVGELQLAVVNSNLLVYREQSAPGGFIASRELMLSNGTVQATATAPESGSGFSFAYWQVNGERQANAAGTSPFAISVTATQNMDVVAVYLLTAQDTNGEGLPDWWQFRHTGTLTNAVDSDADEDGIPLAREYALGLNPNIPNRLEGGGVSLRVGELQLAVVNSNLLVYREQSAPGGFVASRELMLSNGTVQTTTTAPESGSGYAFTYWTVNGERQSNAAGAGFNPLTLNMTQNMDVVAHYTATTLYSTETGIPDWWLEHHTGSLTNTVDSDADEDGIILSREWELGTSPGVANTLDGGGVSLRVGALSSTLQVDPLSDDDADGLTWEREQELGLNPYIANTLDGGGVSLRVGDIGLVDVQVLLGVFLEPTNAIMAGALWRVDGGDWYPSGEYHLMAAGPRWVEFRDADGWEAPIPQSIPIYDHILAITSTYVQVGMGELTVAIEPEEAQTAGAQWRLDGPTWETTNNAGLEWRTNGAVVSLTAREQRPYGVIGKDVPGWHTPLSQEAWVTNGQRTDVTLTYSAAGTLAVTATPPAAAALGAWRVDEGDWQLFGESETLLIGDYELEFQPVAGWLTPTNQSVTISQGATVSITGEYVFDDVAGCEPLPLDWKRTAEASGEEAGLYAAGNAVDGDLATRWRSPVDNDQWLRIDLGRVSTLMGLTIQWDAAYAQAYTVDLSLDGEIWSEVATQTNGVGGLETLYWPPQTARYARLNLSERFYSQWGFGIWDMDFLSPCGVEEILPSEATWTPSSPTDDEPIAIRYQPNDGPLAAAHTTQVLVRYNVNGGAPTSGMDVAMAVDTNGLWTGQIQAEPGDTHVDFVFHSGNGVWDVTGNSSWGFALRPGANNVVRPDPGTLTRYRDYVGQDYLFSVTGSVPGTIWGTGLYKDDSSLAVAAVHAGALTNGERGTVAVTMEGPQEAFTGSETNGVVSLDYGAWTGSYSVARFMEPELALLGTNGAVIAEGAAASLATGTDFGRVAAGTTPTQTLRVVNTGLSDMDVTGAEITGANSNAFQILGLPLTMSAGQTSAVYLVYAAQATAGEEAEVTLLNNTVRSNFTFGVRGTVPRELSMAGLQVNDKTYDGYISGTVASYGTPQEVVPGDEVTVNTSRVEALFEDAGAGEDKPVTVSGWSLTGADAYKYDLGDQMATATIHRAVQTLSFPAIPDQDWVDSTLTLQATASSGLPVTFTVSGPATSVGNILTFTSTGVVSVTASQSDSNWTLVSETRTFEVYSIGRLTWEPLSPLAGQAVVFTYQPELGPLADARTAYLEIDWQPDGALENPTPAMKGDASNGWTAVYLVPETATNLTVALVDENGVRDDGRSTPWQVPVSADSSADPAPSNMTAYRDRVGESFVFLATGNDQGSLWGTGIYTDDSGLSAACVHAGVLAHGETGVVTVTVLGPQTSFTGSVQNGMTSSSYGTFPGSYSVSKAANGALHLSATRLNWTVDETDWTPESQMFVLENTGSESLEFDVQGTAAWLTVEPSAGALVGGGSLTVAVNWVEQTLPIGDYLCTLEIDSTNAINPPQYLNVLLDVAISNGLASVSLGDLEQVYDGTLRVATATTEPQGRTVSFTYDGNPSAPTDAGSYAVVATVTDPGWLGSATGTLVVAQAPQTITFPALADQVVTGQVALAATASSGLDVAFEVVDGPAELSAGVLSFSGTGTVTVVARQSGNANWEAALDVTNAFAVTKVLAMVQLQALEQVYDGTARTVTATSDPAGLPVQITYDGQETAPVAAGAYAVTATINHEAYSGMATGLLVVARAIPTVSVWPVAANDITYGQTLADAGLDVSGAQSSVPGTYSYDNSDVEPEVGSYSAAVTFTPTDAENYEPAAGMVTVTVESAVNYFTTEYHSLSNNQVPANWELVVNESSVQLENGRLVAKPTNANGYLLREGVMPDDTTTLTCSWKGNLEYSEWGMCSGLRLTHGETVVIIRAMTADYNFGDQTHISMTLTGTNGAATFFEELIPLQFGEYDFQVTIENGIILFESHLIDGDPYFSVISPIPSEAEFSLQNVNKIDFGVHTTTDNDNWLNDISILLEDGEIGSKVWRWPVATTAITYGQTLVEAGLDDSEALSSVPGTYAYDNPGFVPNAGSIAAPVTFTPMDTLYESVSGTVMVTVNLATPTVSVWPVAANAITYGQTLADAGLDVADAQSSVPGTYAYDAPDVVPEIGSYSAAVTFRPTDNANYTMAAGTVAVTVNPDVPDTVWFDVFSAHGVSHPTTGRHEIAYGTLITNVLEAGIADEGLTRYVANGFDLQNGEVLASSATSAVVRLTNNTSLTWQWLTEHWLAVGASFHGTVDTGSGWQAEGSIITLTAQPSAYYDFDRWLGVAAAQRMDNPLQLEMDAPHSIQAIFKERLTSNGTPEWWLAQQGWTNDFEAAAADDPDGDGSPTWEEQLAGTDPNDPASFFRFEGLAFSATHIGLYWPSIAGREYQIEYSTNLTQAAWNLFPNGEQIAADPPENQRDIVVTNLPERHRMFRVSVRLATNEVSHEVAYVAGPNGAVSGATFQELGSGEIGQMVWAVPDDGYEFVQWSDGSTDNPRTDMDVDAAQVLTAEFAPTGASPPEGQAIEAVSVEAPVVRTYADTTTIAVEASRNCYGTVEILRTAVSVTPIGVIQYVPGEVVRRLETPLMAGRNQVHWDGLNDSGRGCSNGLYQFRILATNAVGEAYQSYSPASTTNTVSVEASGLSPTTPRFRANEPCRMSYTLGSPAAMAVFVEQGDTTWDSWVQFREAGSHIDDWSGRHSTDGQLLDGGFALTALARELPENALVLDRQLLTDVEAEIYAIRPVYDQVTTIHYTLAAEADVWVELENPSGTTALLGVADGLEAGPHSFVWDGKVSNTAIFSEAGDYTLRIAAASEELDVEQNVFLNVMGF